MRDQIGLQEDVDIMDCCRNIYVEAERGAGKENKALTSL
jgi:hypothetical protein